MTNFEGLNAWCEANGFDVCVVDSDDGHFWYEDETETVYFGHADEDESTWLGFVKSLGLEKADVIPIEVQALLHEIGHNQTFDILDDEDWEIYAIAQMAWKDDSDSQLMYYNLAVEKEATLWAINYMNTHFDECMELAQMC